MKLPKFVFFTPSVAGGMLYWAACSIFGGVIAMTLIMKAHDLFAAGEALHRIGIVLATVGTIAVTGVMAISAVMTVRSWYLSFKGDRQ